MNLFLTSNDFSIKNGALVSDVLNDKVYIFGGYQTDDQNEIMSASRIIGLFQNESWKLAGLLKLARYAHNCIMSPNGWIYVVGGESGNAQKSIL